MTHEELLARRRLGSGLYLCKTHLQREIEATDRQIDQLVYLEAFSCQINTKLLNFSVSFK